MKPFELGVKGENLIIYLLGHHSKALPGLKVSVVRRHKQFFVDDINAFMMEQGGFSQHIINSLDGH